MKNLTKFSALALATGVLTTPVQAVEIEVGYAYSSLFDVTMERLIPEFKKAHPDIDVKFRATYENYEDGTNTILRESVAGDLPDDSNPERSHLADHLQQIHAKLYSYHFA